MDNILRLIGIAKKAGYLELGEEPVGSAARAHHARLILLASDAASNSARRAGHYGEAGNVLWLTVPYTKAELGFIVGRSVCAMMAVTDAGLASNIVTKLAAADPEKYGPAAEQLKTKADKVLRRQKEQRAHEKNLRSGKSRPWAPPPKGVAPPPEAPKAPYRPKREGAAPVGEKGEGRYAREKRETAGPRSPRPGDHIKSGTDKKYGPPKGGRPAFGRTKPVEKRSTPAGQGSRAGRRGPGTGK